MTRRGSATLAFAGRRGSRASGSGGLGLADEAEQPAGPVVLDHLCGEVCPVTVIVIVADLPVVDLPHLLQQFHLLLY